LRKKGRDHRPYGERRRKLLSFPEMKANREDEGMQPLAGIRVLDFSTLLPGPMASLMLAQAGATVVKIEKPGGEDMRRFPPALPDGSAAPYVALNAGKTVLELDLKDPDAPSRLRPLIERTDVVIEQFRPGVMERLGLGYEAMRAINPKLIYCSISGYGQNGPRAGEAGHDVNYIAASGLLSLSPGAPQAPTLPPALIADIAGGSMPAVINILLALRERDVTGEGRWLDISMTEGTFIFAWYAMAQGVASGRYPGARENFLTGASPRYGLYATQDGRFLACGALEQKFWDGFCAVIDLPQDLRDDARDPEATRAEVTRIVAGRTAAQWAEALAGSDCCVTIVKTMDEALSDPHFAARGVAFPDRTGGPRVVTPIAPGFR
jgi:crotonobetainyl-CoA:carnitine CoA-transferase CaiB-like acyl-CoA transferase